ncbi:hypothetical protein Pth03_10020 [Planotetraspora thailandica]|uniref:Archease domain-containing protein n=1 Tax=Planotetraspora thailandica TaxID=487172 RepID=A0A8J3UWN4_9ACTN|nr:archease [Planotetraspora thailandica]GII52613.1 hypothetical protein Pth03_10020 [Planotetraspora thailandica]
MVSGGHRAVPRAADIAVEAWADSREECLAEEVRALVDIFARFHDAVPDDSVEFALMEETDETLLVAVLNEVIYQIETYGRVAVDVSVDERTGATQGQIEVRLGTVPLAAVDQVGTVPKAVALHGVRFGREAGMWRAHATVDV